MSSSIDKRVNFAVAILGAATVCCALVAQAQVVPAEVAVPDQKTLAAFHAEGSQIYECKADASGKLAWVFREPVASMFDAAGATVGRHYAGPKWELNDGSLVMGKVSGRAPGASADDIPLLKLEATVLSQQGQLSKSATIQRLATKGGQASGACERAGSLKSVAYSADYVFLLKP